MRRIDKSFTKNVELYVQLIKIVIIFLKKK